MGMDVHGLMPKQNIKRSEFTTYNRWVDEDWSDKIKAFDDDSELQQKYWDEEDKYQSVNVGVYFRNACARWRGLWDFCYFVGKDENLIDTETWREGHHNDGAGLDQVTSLKLAEKLQEAVKDGTLERFATEWEIEANTDDKGRLPKKSQWFYRFDVDNVSRFVGFLKECGGFRIC